MAAAAVTAAAPASTAKRKAGVDPGPAASKSVKRSTAGRAVFIPPDGDSDDDGPAVINQPKVSSVAGNGDGTAAAAAGVTIDTTSASEWQHWLMQRLASTFTPRAIEAFMDKYDLHKPNSLEAVAADGTTPFLRACSNADTIGLRQLLQLGVDVQSTHAKTGQNGLHVLLETVSKPALFGHSHTFVSAYSESFESVCRAGVNPNLPDRQSGITPFIHVLYLSDAYQWSFLHLMIEIFGALTLDWSKPLTNRFRDAVTAHASSSARSNTVHRFDDAESALAAPSSSSSSTLASASAAAAASIAAAALPPPLVTIDSPLSRLIELDVKAAVVQSILTLHRSSPAAVSLVNVLPCLVANQKCGAVNLTSELETRTATAVATAAAAASAAPPPRNSALVAHVNAFHTVWGWAPLHCACRAADVTALLRAGADCTLLTLGGLTAGGGLSEGSIRSARASRLASDLSFCGLSNLLFTPLRYGRTDRIYPIGWTPLLCYAERNEPSLIVALLEHPFSSGDAVADVNAVDSPARGIIALHLVMSAFRSLSKASLGERHRAAVASLIRHGADVNRACHATSVQRFETAGVDSAQFVAVESPITAFHLSLPALDSENMTMTWSFDLINLLLTSGADPTAPFPRALLPKSYPLPPFTSRDCEPDDPHQLNDRFLHRPGRVITIFDHLLLVRAHKPKNGISGFQILWDQLTRAAAEWNKTKRVPALTAAMGNWIPVPDLVAIVIRYELMHVPSTPAKDKSRDRMADDSSEESEEEVEADESGDEMGQIYPTQDADGDDEADDESDSSNS